VILLIVTKDRTEESPTRVLELAPSDVPLVMSSSAWDEYKVPASPYFIYVDRKGQIRGEGSATSWEGVRSLFKDALLDERLATRYDFAGLSTTPILKGRDDVERDDRALSEAGMTPGDPSLYAPPTIDAKR
jgi:hypothetical protein